MVRKADYPSNCGITFAAYPSSLPVTKMTNKKGVKGIARNKLHGAHNKRESEKIIRNMAKAVGDYYNILIGKQNKYLFTKNHIINGEPIKFYYDKGKFLEVDINSESSMKILYEKLKELEKSHNAKWSSDMPYNLNMNKRVINKIESIKDLKNDYKINKESFLKRWEEDNLFDYKKLNNFRCYIDKSGECNAKVVQIVKKNLQKAWESFHNPKQKNKRPTKRKDNQKTTFSCTNQEITLYDSEGNKIPMYKDEKILKEIPAKTIRYLKGPNGFVLKIKQHKTIYNSIGSFNFHFDSSNKFYVSLGYHNPNTLEKDKRKIENSVGIDLGLKDLATIVDNNEDYLTIPHTKHYKHYKNKKADLQRKQAAFNKNSKEFLKFQKRINNIDKKIANIRKDERHKLTRELVDNFDHICIEDLSLEGMKKLWGESVSDASLGTIKQQLEYKSKREGVTLTKVGRMYPSSKLCNKCGFKNDDLKVGEEAWLCTSCNEILDRDKNAAQNILKEGQEILKKDLDNTR